MSADPIELLVTGQPIPWARVRHNSRTGVHFNPPRYANWKAAAVQAFRLQARGRSLQGAVTLNFISVFQRPKGRKHSAVRELRLGAPDVDNLGKAIMDSLEKSKILRNDSQVAELYCLRLYGRTGEAPCTEITVQPCPRQFWP